MVVAITVQQSVAYVLALVVVVGFVLWLVANARRAKPEVGAELELAANRRPYYDDDEMEGKRLDGVLRWALISLTIIAVGLPLYWLAEPGRQSGAIENFEETFAHRGEALYAPTAEGGFDCATCHGGVSGGLVTHTMTDADGTLRQVTWKAPSLDDVLLRMTEEQVREVLVYGRPFSPMPAWGLEGGGPMNEQQIDNLISYLKSVTISRDEARARATTAAQEQLALLRDPEAALAEAEDALASAETDDDRLRASSVLTEIEGIIASGQKASLGAALFNTQCARCHTAGWSFYEPEAPGSGAFGPPLANVLTQFPDQQDHYDFVADGAEFGEVYGRQGKASGRMPFFSTLLTKDQIEAIVAYERELAAQPEEQ